MPSTRFKFDGAQARIIVVAALLYAASLAVYFPLASRYSGAWGVERQKLIASSPVVYVAPYGKMYHQREHYGRLSSPLSLYEATERQYEYCPVCHPPAPASQLTRPWYFSHPVLTVVFFSWLYVTPVVAMLLFIRLRRKRVGWRQHRA